MVECTSIVKEALQNAVNKYGKDLLKKPWFEVRKVLIREYRLPSKCYDKTYIIQAISYIELSESSSTEGKTIEIVYTSPRKQNGLVSPGGGAYPNYSLAEAIFIGLYQEDPVNAHERMYHILEPVLLSDKEDVLPVKKALFMPIDARLWDRIQERFIQFLRMIDDERRGMVCRALKHTFNLLLLGLEYRVLKEKYAWTFKIDSRLLSLCPSLTEVLGVK